MAERSLFFNAVETSPGVFDREYLESDFAIYFGSVLSSGIINSDESPGVVVSVENGTLNTVVSMGKALLKGHFYENTTPLTLTHSIPEATLDRIDRIVLRLDVRNQSRYIKAIVKEGDPAATPVAPVLQRDNFIHEISLAQIRVRQNTVQLLPADLIDERLIDDLCGLVTWTPKVPTSQFQEQWDEFMESIEDEGFATVASVEAVDARVTIHEADDVRHTTAVEKAKWNNSVNSINIGATTVDPNTTEEAYILTNHANSPGGGLYWHIQTFFYSSKTSNRAQQAISYSGSVPQFRVRHFYQGVWVPWSVDPFQSVVDGKNSVKSAILAKGGTVGGGNPPDFSHLVTGVNGISTGVRRVSGQIYAPLLRKSFPRGWASDGTVLSDYVNFDFSQLPFIPEIITFFRSDKVHGTYAGGLWKYDFIQTTGDGANAYNGQYYLRVPYSNGVVSLPIASIATDTTLDWVAYERK
ncbi:pyocin knob domain-containing protein [Sporosarcina sp. FSL K6-2383]|uniref:pyocin knob domain-containing protein n=1 Tax=Sporosarcina sp. FSL K6-2383 TaxID=2921556 RepID=UPI00315A6D18